MHDQNTAPTLVRQPASSSGKARCWGDVYPVLLRCLSEGRAPSGEELEQLAARMDREIGASADTVWSRVGSTSVRRRKLLAAARAALLGRHDSHSPSLNFPLVLRGH